MSEILIGKNNALESLMRAPLSPASRLIAELAIDSVPVVDAEPVRHGRWIYNGYSEYPICSYCKQSDTYAGDYCGNCGADMREVSEDADD